MKIEKLYQSNNNQIFNVYVYFEYTSRFVQSFPLSPSFYQDYIDGKNEKEIIFNKWQSEKDEK